MAPDQWGDVGKVVFVDFHAAQPDLLNGFLHVDRVPVYDGIESEAQGTELLLLPLSQCASDFAALAVMNAPPKAVTQFRMVELRPDQRKLVRELVLDGKSISAVAKTFNVHPATIYRVIEG